MKRLLDIFSSLPAKVSTPLSRREGLRGILFLSVLILVASCGPDKDHGRIKGTIEGINDTRIQAYAEGVSGQIDTIDVKGGRFTYEPALAAPAIVTLVYPNFTSTTLVVGPGETVKLSGSASSLSLLEIDGNEDNRLLTEFRKHYNGKSTSEQRREAATFIRSHAKSLAAVVLFCEFFAKERIIEQNPTASLLTELEKAQPKNAIVAELSERLRPLLDMAPGQKFPQFAAVSVKGDSVTSRRLSGKALLVAVGGYYDGNFYNMKRYANDLKACVDTTAFDFVFISLDSDQQLCKRNATYTPLPGHLVCDGKSFESPLIKKLGLRYVPASFVVGKDGLIKGRDIPMEDWAKTIPSLIK